MRRPSATLLCDHYRDTLEASCAFHPGNGFTDCCSCRNFDTKSASNVPLSTLNHRNVGDFDVTIAANTFEKRSECLDILGIRRYKLSECTAHRELVIVCELTLHATFKCLSEYV